MTLKISEIRQGQNEQELITGRQVVVRFDDREWLALCRAADKEGDAQISEALDELRAKFARSDELALVGQLRGQLEGARRASEQVAADLDEHTERVKTAWAGDDPALDLLPKQVELNEQKEFADERIGTVEARLARAEAKVASLWRNMLGALVTKWRERVKTQRADEDLRPLTAELEKLLHGRRVTGAISRKLNEWEPAVALNKTLEDELAQPEPAAVSELAAT